MLPEIKKLENFNENRLKQILDIDFIVSKKNRELSDDGPFLIWSFATNHVHEIETIGDEYFVVWCGLRGSSKCKSLVFGRIPFIEEKLNLETSYSILEYLREK